MNAHLPLLPAAVGYPALPPLSPKARIIAERLTRMLDDEVTARRDQIDMVARLATGDDRLSTRFVCDARSTARTITATTYRAMAALDRALLEALDPNETLDLVRTHDELSQDAMTDAVFARLDEIQSPPEADSLPLDFDHGTWRTAHVR